MQSNEDYDTEGSDCTLEELDTRLNKFFESKEFNDALSSLKQKIGVYEGFDTESNNYTLEQLSKDITKREQSKESKTLMNVLKQKIIEKHPHKIKL